MNGMGIRGNEMDQPMRKKALRHAPHLRPKSTGQTHGRHLAKTAHFDHLIIPFWGPRDFKGPFRMGDDGGDSAGDQLEKNFFPLIRKSHKIKFEQEVTTLVVDRHNFSLFAKLRKVWGEMDIGTGQDPEFAIRSAEFGRV